MLQRSAAEILFVELEQLGVRRALASMTSRCHRTQRRISGTTASTGYDVRRANYCSSPYNGVPMSDAHPWNEPIYEVARRLGPEAELEDAVVAHLPRLLPTDERPSCIFGSRTIGAGAPDLTVIYLTPGVEMPLDGHPSIVDILAYLRVVNKVGFDTLRDRLRLSQEVFDSCLHVLSEAGAFRASCSSLALHDGFRQPVREIVTIEAKVSKWRDAVSQAARNRAFAHRSFVALPEAQARLASRDARVALLGIGVISIGGDQPNLIRRSRRSQPRVWRYYFELALASLRQVSPQDALHRAHRSGKDMVPAV